jgi:bifunctional DNA-binding transcriptional regulator/antitoxin component of YhaV-PrlF toxin-antitoxin module
MTAQIATLTSPETMPLSPEAQSALGLRAGSRIAVTIEQGRVILQPLEEDDLDQLAGSLSSTPSMADELQQERAQEAKSKVDTIAAELRAMFAGEPSLEDEYFRDRDKDKW